jgi:hypothetical protein
VILEAEVNGPLPYSLPCPIGLVSAVPFKFVWTIWERGLVPYGLLYTASGNDVTFTGAELEVLATQGEATEAGPAQIKKSLRTVRGLDVDAE